MDKKDVRYFVVALNIPLMMAACPIVGYFLGVGVEKIWAVSPYGSTTGLILGIVAAIRETARSLKRLSKMDM
ncbi:MAG: AtpZ/AtpI family protein [Pseudomonadota bacterium]